ncbi:MAG: ABC transporter ATP-binding protein [Bacillota bacterium]
MIKVEELYKKFPGQKIPAVNGINLDIKEGEICVFVGPSGCGKSTTLRLINRLIEPTSGKIFIDGQDVMKKDPDLLRQNIGYVIQQIGLLPHKTIGENISIVPRLLKWPKDKINKRVDELLELVGLDVKEVRDRYPYQLSGGMMQRVGVARAMAVNPPIMLMDEPFGAVDPLVRSYLQDEFLKIQLDINKTICFVTHSINEAIKMGDKIAIMNEGQIVQFGTPEEILSNPANSFVAEFVGEDRGVKMLYMGKCEGLMEECSASFKEDYGNKDIPSIQAHEPLNNALAAMLENDSDAVAIMHKEKLVGVITWEELKQHVSKMGGA